MLHAEDDALRAAGARSEAAGYQPVDPAVGALLRFLARLNDARAVVELAAGGGVSGLWLLGGMERGTLTSLEADPDRQGLAQRAYAQAGVADRVRSITGPPATVLPRLADANYDLVFLDGPAGGTLDDLTHARRLLRPGGTLVADDPDDLLLRAIADDPAVSAVTLPIGGTVLVAALLSQ